MLKREMNGVERTHIRIDQQMLLEQLYRVKAQLPFGADDAEEELLKVITLINNAPIDQKGSTWAKGRVSY